MAGTGRDPFFPAMHDFHVAAWGLSLDQKVPLTRPLTVTGPNGRFCRTLWGVDRRVEMGHAQRQQD